MINCHDQLQTLEKAGTPIAIAKNKLVMRQHNSPGIVAMMGSSTIKRLNFDSIAIKEPKHRHESPFTKGLSRNDSNHVRRLTEVKVHTQSLPGQDHVDIFPRKSNLGHRNGINYETESSMMKQSIEFKRQAPADEGKQKAMKQVHSLGAQQARSIGMYASYSPKAILTAASRLPASQISTDMAE